MADNDVLMGVIADKEREIERLRGELAVDRAVCICGCDEHEDYGEDGESCEKEHECIRVCVAARDITVEYRERAEQADAEVERLRAELRSARASSLGNAERSEFLSDELTKAKARLAKVVEAGDRLAATAGLGRDCDPEIETWRAALAAAQPEEESRG